MIVQMLAQILPAGSYLYASGQVISGGFKVSSDYKCKGFPGVSVKNVALRPMALLCSFEDLESTQDSLHDVKATRFTKKEVSNQTRELVDMILSKEKKIDLTLVLRPWYDKLFMEDWNRVISNVGKDDWKMALEIFRLLKDNSDLFRESKTSSQGVRSDFDEQHGNIKERRECTSKNFLKACTTVITTLARNRRLKEVQSIVEEVNHQGVKPDLFFYNAVLGLYGSMGMVKQASEIVKEMKKNGLELDHVTYESLIAAHLNKKTDTLNLQMALQVLHRMMSNNLKPGFKTFANLIKACCKESQADKADEVLLAMSDAGHKPDMKIWIKMLQIHGQKGNYMRCEELFHILKAQGTPLIPSLYENLLLAYCRAGRLIQAFSVMRESKLAVKPSLMAYNILIDACAKSSLSSEALQFFVDVCDSGLKPNVITFTSVINALVKGRKFDKAEELYKRMQSDDISPNIYTYTSMIHAYSLRGWTKLGDQVCMSLRMSNCHINEAAYGAMLQLYLLGGWYEHAAKVLKEMEEKGLEPDTAGYGVLFSACGETADEITPVERAVQRSIWEPCRVLHSLLFSDSSSFETRMLEYSAADRLSAFFKSYCETKDRAANLSLYNALMDALWRKGLRKRAQFIMLQARSWLQWYRRPIYRENDCLLDLRGLSIGGAQVAVLDWLSGVDSTHVIRMIIVTGGAAKQDMKPGMGMNLVKNAVTATLGELGSPFREDPENSGWLNATTSDVVKWLNMPGIREAASLIDSCQNRTPL